MKSLVRLAGLFALMMFFEFSQSQTIAQWRGVDRKGVYDDKNLLTSWPASGPVLTWKNSMIGNGFGSPAITSDRIYITGELDSIHYLFCLDLKGNLIWKTDCGKEWVKTFPGSRSTPTVTSDYIYVISGIGNLACVDRRTGQRLWMVDHQVELHGEIPFHGHSESPLVEGDLVYLMAGGKDTNVVAFDRLSGKIQWICKGVGERPAYNSPVMIRMPDRNILVVFSAYALMGIDAATGKLLWTHLQDNTPITERGPARGDTHSNSVWYEDGNMYYIEGDGNGAVRLSLSADGLSLKQVWRVQDVDNYMGGFIKNGNFLYSCLFEKKKLVSFDSESGKELDSLNVGRGAVIMAEGLLYYYNLKGEMCLIKPEGSKLSQISMFKITEGTKEHFSHPVIQNGILYLRHGSTLLAYDIRKK